MSQNTMQDLYGITANYYLRLNFSSLMDIVDTLGGIEVHSDFTFSSDGSHFVEGLNQMNGRDALNFARARKIFQSGDRQRGANQQLVIEGIIAKLSEPGNLLRYQELLDTFAKSIQTNIPKEKVAELVDEQLSSGRGWSISTTAVNGTDDSQPTHSMGDQRLYVMQPDQATVDAAKAEIEATMQASS
jgi:anionic cell wall polymer biosynthesis LytR-Cps2A-Psr (LCP) family protein